MLTHVARLQDPAPVSRRFADITADVLRELEASGVTNGRVTLATEGPQSRLVVNERESGLLQDLVDAEERSGAAGVFIGTSTVSLPAVDGRLRIGDWQRILLLSRPGSTPAAVVVQVEGE